ncbi:MAG TPA: VPLPA-CTERM-specific exosortase XrtD [Crenotrichaceae bacterium]|nr:VPLPA-CTERM-specific exosortase XrtD [Crenotrichaceae bacterium]
MNNTLRQTLSNISSGQINYARWFFYALLAVFIAFVFRDGIEHMIHNWNSQEEYSHGWLIPVVTGYLIWQEKEKLSLITPRSSWLGVGIAAFALFLFLLGELSTLYIIEQYALVILIFGLVLALEGYERFKLIWVPLIMLFFMIPLPNFLYRSLSAELQLISSSLGVDMIRLCDISVNLQGNVIDLGTYQLQVVEACNGLRYLFPLMSLAFICAYFFKGPLWKRAIIFLSSIPITIFMNSFRIAIIGVLVEYWGIDMANGFLHDFEGWAIFMLCLAILIFEMWLLAKLPQSTKMQSDTHQTQATGTTNRLPAQPLSGWKQGVTISMMLVLCGITVASIDSRGEIKPDRKYFVDFPSVIGNWKGSRIVMEKKYRDVLNFDDYFMADFSDNIHPPVNFYVAYYESQRKGSSIHSPRSCIPGGGWRIQSVTTEAIDINGGLIQANRVLIQKGKIRQLVYYWFDQRGRNLTNEYLVKWFLFWDALTRSRTDGALVRFTTVIIDREGLEEVEDRLLKFMQTATPMLNEYIPD